MSSSRALSCFQKKQVEERELLLSSDCALVECKCVMLQVSGFLVLFLVLKAAVWLVIFLSNSELAAFFVVRALSKINVQDGINLK